MIINLKASSFNLYIFNREHLKIIHTIKPEFFQNRKVNNSCPWRTMKIAPEFLGQKTLVIVDMNMFYMISLFPGKFPKFHLVSVTRQVSMPDIKGSPQIR